VKGYPDIYFCDGFHGQRVYIVPSKDVVIVRMGLNGHGEFDFDKFVRRILDALP
jgi:CubicO group peptidase (beta-lactamase class C family)